MDIKSLRLKGIPHEYFSTLWAGGAARLCGVISEKSLIRAVEEELNHLDEEAMAKNRESALSGWALMAAHAGRVTEGEPFPPMAPKRPEWIECPWDPVFISAPAIRSPETSRHVKTGLWRTLRPVIDYSRCRKCWWNCAIHCPDSAITINKEGAPVIDYEYCKGCLICAEECPRRAITVLPEESGSDPDRGDHP